jgi:tRNA(fMet)-specific endonuclease VapC
MQRLMLDTNIISYALKRPHSALAARYRRTPAAAIMVSSIVEMELRYGVARLPKEAKLPSIVEEALRTLTIAPWDSACAQTCATLRAKLQPKGITIPYADAMIAAHAIALNRTLVTNDSDFNQIPGLVTEYWPIEDGDPRK